MSEPRILHIPALSPFPLELWIRGERKALGRDREQAHIQEQKFSQELRAELGDRLLSIAHSHGVTVALAGEPGQSWGADLEFVGRQISERAQERFWSPEEQVLAPHLTPLMAWTLKEAALKARGRALPSQPITQWQLTAAAPSDLFVLNDGNLTAWAAILPEQMHGIPQGIVAVASLQILQK